MRVTKAVREYIEKQVRAKIEKKYLEEKTESKRIRDIKSDIEQRAREAAFEAAKAILDEATQHGDILEYKTPNYEKISFWGLSDCIQLKDACYINSVHKWDSRMRDEIHAVVQDIIVTLELGGNKTDLDRMLSEI
jgi:hypothetical protein